MKIKKIIELEIEKKKGIIICRDLPTLCMVCGSKSVCGNLALYGVEKKGNKWYVGIDRIKERILILENRKADINNSLEIMKQLIK